MKLHHTVNHTPNEEIAKAIERVGLLPMVADEYKELVPLEVRHLPVIWFAEGIWQGWEFPVFEVASENLDAYKLRKVDVTGWWVYQGFIPKNVIVRLN